MFSLSERIESRIDYLRTYVAVKASHLIYFMKKFSSLIYLHTYNVYFSYVEAARITTSATAPTHMYLHLDIKYHG